MTALHGDTVRYREIMDNINEFMEKNALRQNTRVITRRFLRAKCSSNTKDWGPLLGMLSPDLQAASALGVAAALLPSTLTD